MKPNLFGRRRESIVGRKVIVGLAVVAAVAVAALVRPAASAAAPAADPVFALPDRPDAPPLAAEERDAPGLAVTFVAAAGAAGGDTRASRLAALYVPAAQPASPFVAAGPFVATFDGFLNLRLRDTYTFSAEGRGDVVVSVNGKEVFKAAGDDLSKAEPGAAVRLNKGKNKLTVRYATPAGADGKPAADGKPSGDAAFRLLWTVKGETYAEPLPPTVLSHNAGAEAVAKGTRVREGRQLVADLRCASCHAYPMADVVRLAVAPSPVMPELAADAPDLAAVGGRLNAGWMAAWINHPHGLRPTAHMPRLFKPAGGDDAAVDPRAADAAAYLATLAAPAADKAIVDGAAPAGGAAPAAAGDEVVARGGQLFSTLNCITCHRQPAAQDEAAPPPPAEGDAAAGDKPPERVPLKYVKAKFKPGALAAFLLNPSAHYQWIAMPNFRLSKEEADALAAFLLAEAAGELPADLPAGDPTKGKQLVEASGCLNCHAVGTGHAGGGDGGKAKSTLAVAALNDIPKDGWTRGCLAADDAGRKAAPAYALTDAQRQAIVAFAATDRTSLLRDAPAEFAERQIKALNCAGCHARDGRESLLATTYDAELKELEQKYPAPKGEHAESFAPDQRAPLMTWFGEKLRPQWAAAFVAGEVKYKPRPYLHARMPAFAARAAGLAAGMAAEHGCPPAEPAHAESVAEMAAVGSKLAGRTPNQAFSCTQCHAVAQQPPFAPFEAPAVNFAYASDRLRKDYYHRWVHNPLKLDPTTKMPAFERDDGKTTITGVYDGDARKQFEAIWQYLLAGPAIKPPAE
jgi:cytochrome c1